MLHRRRHRAVLLYERPPLSAESRADAVAVQLQAAVDQAGGLTGPPGAVAPPEPVNLEAASAATLSRWLVPSVDGRRSAIPGGRTSLLSHVSDCGPIEPGSTGSAPQGLTDGVPWRRLEDFRRAPGPGQPL